MRRKEKEVRYRLNELKFRYISDITKFFLAAFLFASLSFAEDRLRKAFI